MQVQPELRVSGVELLLGKGWVRKCTGLNWQYLLGKAVGEGQGEERLKKSRNYCPILSQSAFLAILGQSRMGRMG